MVVAPVTVIRVSINKGQLYYDHKHKTYVLYMQISATELNPGCRGDWTNFTMFWELNTNQLTVLTNLINHHLYCQIPLLAFSTTDTVTAKFNYFQIPHSARNYTLPSDSNTCKFQDN